MMKYAAIALAGLLCGVVAGGDLHAQPILDRVEQLLRDQLSAAQAPDSVLPGYLGIIADDSQEQGRGVRVVDLVAGGAAAQGGLQKGDLITAINGLPMRVMDDIAAALDGRPEGTRMTITIDRAGTSRQQQITLGRRRDAQPVGKKVAELPGPGLAPADVIPPRPLLGIRTVPVDEPTRQANGLAKARGAVVIAVAPGSTADRAGVPLGAVIVGLNGKPIGAPEELAAAVRQLTGNEAELAFVDRGEETVRRVFFTAQARPSDAPQLELRGRPVIARAPPANLGGSVAPAPEKTKDDRAQIGALEARIRQLEQRIEQLEAAMSRNPQKP